MPITHRRSWVPASTTPSSRCATRTSLVASHSMGAWWPLSNGSTPRCTRPHRRGRSLDRGARAVPAVRHPRRPGHRQPAGPLAAFFVRAGLLAPGETRIVLQGARIGRPSRLNVTVEATGDEITDVLVGGKCRRRDDRNAHASPANGPSTWLTRRIPAGIARSLGRPFPGQSSPATRLRQSPGRRPSRRDRRRDTWIRRCGSGHPDPRGLREDRRRRRPCGLRPQAGDRRSSACGRTRSHRLRQPSPRSRSTIPTTATPWHARWPMASPRGGPGLRHRPGHADGGQLAPGSGAADRDTPQLAEMTRRHNDANVLCLAGRELAADEAWKITEVWLATPFEGGRHARRVALLDTLVEGS